ncbi:MAG: AAA family ATPase [Methyloprofundus sp.]|nr:AAA family ATPase [Methyloprofundus sp.]
MQDLVLDSKLAIPYYTLLEKLGESLNASVYKAVAKEDSECFFIIKILKHQLNNSRQCRYLAQKVERLKIIHDPRIITAHSFNSASDYSFIVRRYFPGMSLGNFLTECGGKFLLRDFFNIASELALALNAVHEAGIIHGGIKLNNILIQEKTHAIRLVDFLNPVDIQEISHFIYDPNFISHTLSYTSPEQTGRINHRVEFSTDIYSLGIVFYYLLTGSLPFQNTDPLALIHAHLAEEALPVHQVNPLIPTIISDIIAKMCMKEPEKRYQTAIGLYADIQQCKESYQHNKRLKPFVLGVRDHTQRIIFISRMVGRNRETQLILDGYYQVISGKGFHSGFISGLPGIGKTRLIQELQRPLVDNKAYFSFGKFDQYQKNIPYSSLIQALRNLIRTFLTESDQRVERWKKHILLALGNQGKVITDVIPELSILLGQQADVADLPPVEARNRFNNLFGAFLASLSSQEHPLVLFIDDLQWCDSATFVFLQYLFANTEDYPHLFFMGAYRHNEVDDSHPLSLLLKEIKGLGQPPQEIRIGLLEKKACHEMVAYILDLPLQQTEDLALFLGLLTEGNPLFVSESLSWLHSEELLKFSEQGQWGWDMEKIRHSNMPATVVDMFGIKVQRLEAETLEIIKVCACMGNHFSAEEVALINDISLRTLFEYLKPVLNMGVFIENKTEFQFVHDRVQEAVLRLIPKQKKCHIHWRVGKHLLQGQEVDEALEKQDNLFTIAAHLNLGRPETISRKGLLKLAHINLLAGNKALNALATQAANEYYRNGLKLLVSEDWEAHYVLMYRLHQKLAKTELMCGRYEQSEKLLNELLQRAVDDLDRAEALAEQTTSLSSIGDFIKAIETANKGLAYFDKAIPSDDTLAKQKLALLMQAIEESSADIFNDILQMSFTEDRKSKIELVFYSELIPDLYMSGMVAQLYLSAAQSTLHCLQGGMDESVIYSFSIMGLNLGEQGLFEPAFLYQDLAHDLCARYPDTFGATRGINGIVWCNMHSRSHPKEIIDYCQQGIQCGKNCGDLYNAGLTYGPLMWNLQVLGNDLSQLAAVTAECLDFSLKNQLSFSVGLAEAVQAGWIEPMQNRQNNIAPMQEKLSLWESRNHVASAGSYFMLLGVSHYYFARYREADECLNKVQEFLTGMTDNVLKRQWYVFRILNALRYAAEINENKQGLQTRLKPLLEQLEVWADLGPLLKPYLALCHAEWQRCFNESTATNGYYLQAIELAYAQGYLFLTGFINELFADYLLQKNWLSAEQYLNEALRLYRMSAYKGKEIQLLEAYPQLFASRTTELVNVEEMPTEGGVLPDIDVDYLIKSSLALSAEIDPDLLFSKIMTVVLECSGAQQGYLLQHRAGEWRQISKGHQDKQVLEHTETSALNNICQGIVHYVGRTQESVVLFDAQESAEFSNLAEISKFSIRSLLCVPIQRKRELVGILYLENRLSSGVFTADKVHLIELLSLQMAISLENARLISEIGQLNDELEQRINDVTQKNREKDHLLIQQSKLATMGEMINNIAHQWRQPLNALSLLLGNLQDAKQFDELTPEYLDQQIENGFNYIDKMSNTINDFRDFFSPNKPREEFSVFKAVNDAVTLVESSFKAHSVSIKLDISKDIKLYGILNEYAQVILNLLTNAKEAILSHCNSGLISVTLKSQNGKVYLSIKDNGGGIKEDIMQHIFEPYYSTKEGGMGIGLYMSKMIIESSLNGYIEVCNEQDGAKFSIVSPVSL